MNGTIDAEALFLPTSTSSGLQGPRPQMPGRGAEFAASLARAEADPSGLEALAGGEMTVTHDLARTGEPTLNLADLLRAGETAAGAADPRHAGEAPLDPADALRAETATLSKISLPGDMAQLGEAERTAPPRPALDLAEGDGRSLDPRAAREGVEIQTPGTRSADIQGTDIPGTDRRSAAIPKADMIDPVSAGEGDADMLAPRPSASVPNEGVPAALPAVSAKLAEETAPQSRPAPADTLDTLNAPRQAAEGRAATDRTVAAPDVIPAETLPREAGDPRAEADRSAPRATSEAPLPATPDLKGPGLPALPADGPLAFSAAQGDKLALPDAQLSFTQPGSAASTAAPLAPAPAPAMAGSLAPASHIVAATPADVVAIVSQSLTAGDDRQDRIVVQLDPPELGRVSIDFKFDGHGLQHITITGENPEALRQLRLMHFELIQALERHGLGSQDMSFQHHDPRQQAEAARIAAQIEQDPAADGVMPTLPARLEANPIALALTGGGLDIRL